MEKKIQYIKGDQFDDVIKRSLSDIKIDLAFDKKKSEDRKAWLKSYDKTNIIEQ